MPDRKLMDRTQEHVARIKRHIDIYGAIVAQQV
jgi:hypothetical protein